MDVTLDFETRSKADITSGPNRYAEDPSTDALILCWMMDDNVRNIGTWTYKDGTIPDDLLAAVLYDKCMFHAYNAQFEIAIWKHVMCVRHGWPPPPPLHRWRDTMAEVAIAGYPQSLDKASALLGTSQKDSAGKALIKKFSIPNKKGEFASPDENVELFNDFIKYCKQDVIAEREIHNKLRWVKSESEQKVWELVVKMNQRGLPIDTPLVEAVAAQLEINKLYLSEQVKLLTDGRVEKPTQVARILGELSLEYGINLKNLTAETLDDLDLEALPNGAKALITFRQLGGKSSTAKFNRILELVCSDGTVKDNLRYYGAGPGRMSGAGFQPQNLPRYKHKDPEPVINAFMTLDPELLRLMFNVEQAASGLIRPSILAPPSKLICAYDFSGVEARGVCWLCDEQDLIQKILAGLDMYKVQAADMFHVNYDEVDSLQRQVGKILVLACVAEGQRVLTDKGYVPIEKVTTDMLVWDGVEFVSHDGPVYKGVKEVIVYDGLLATRDHVVYTEDGRKIELQKAAREKSRLAKTRPSRPYLWSGDGNISTHNDDKRTATPLVQMQHMQDREVDLYAESIIRKNRGLPKVQSACAGTHLVGKALPRCKGAMPDNIASSVQKLRSKRDRVPLHFCYRNGAVHTRRASSRKGARGRSYRQQRALRTWKYTHGNPKSEYFQQKKQPHIKYVRLQNSVPSRKVRRQHFERIYFERSYVRRDRNEMVPTQPQTKRRVWDLLNAGPRHRFTVEDRLVSNCGYAGGYVVFVNQAKIYKLDVTEDEAKQYVRMFRNSRPKLTQAWKEFENTALLAMGHPGDIFQVGNKPVAFQYLRGFLKMTLPSGRGIYYPEPKLTSVPNRFDGQTVVAITTKWTNSQTHQWGERVMSGPLFFQNAIQGICRDLLVEAQMRLESFGIQQIGSVHDEAISLLDEAGGPTLADVKAIMDIVPPWAKGFPLGGSGYAGKRYKKD